MKKIVTHLKENWIKYGFETFVITIGILGAFMLNNWNEQRKSDEITKVILKQIQLDILNNMETAEYAYMQYNKKDSVFWTMKQKKLTPSDFAGDKNRNYRSSINTYWPMKMKNKGFEDLKTHPGIKPGEYDKLKNHLEWLEYEIMYFNKNIENIIQQLEDHFAYRRANFDWYSSEFWTGEVSDGELDFYAYNPILKNHIALYSEHMYQALSASDVYTTLGLEVYREIAEILGQKEDELPVLIKITMPIYPRMR